MLTNRLSFRYPATHIWVTASLWTTLGLRPPLTQVVEPWGRLLISTRRSLWKTYTCTNLKGEYQVLSFSHSLSITNIKPVFFVGLRVAQVRLLFNLPPQFGRFPHALAYVEWFTQLGLADPNTGLHSVTRSTRHAQRNAEIVSVDRIVGGCHLMPRCGPSIPSSWTTDNILEQISVQYFVNPYINVDTFTLLKSSLFSKWICKCFPTCRVVKKLVGQNRAALPPFPRNPLLRLCRS